MGTLSDILGSSEKITLTKTERAVKMFFDSNEQKKSIEKEVKKNRAEFDKYFEPGDKQDLKRIGLSVNYSQTEKVVLNQDKLLAKVKELGLTDCIKTIELVDEEKVSEKILDGEMNPSELAACNEIKLSSRLTVNRIKE